MLAPAVIAAPATLPAATDDSIPPLQVRVTIPATPSPNAEFDVSERFTDLLMTVFRRSGYNGRITEVEPRDEPKPGSPVLSLNITDWEKNPVGNIDCRFSATLEAGGQERQLGSFTGTSLGLMTGPGGSGLSDAFDSAAYNALRDLLDHLTKEQLLPGLQPR